jgi:hypothetical protein
MAAPSCHGLVRLEGSKMSSTAANVELERARRTVP